MDTNTYKEHTFLDFFADVFTQPEDIEISSVEYKQDALHEDARRIRIDVDKAIKELGLIQHKVV